jgi:hypothetical protein
MERGLDITIAGGEVEAIIVDILLLLSSSSTASASSSSLPVLHPTTAALAAGRSRPLEISGGYASAGERALWRRRARAGAGAEGERVRRRMIRVGEVEVEVEDDDCGRMWRIHSVGDRGGVEESNGQVWNPESENSGTYSGFESTVV